MCWVKLLHKVASGKLKKRLATSAEINAVQLKSMQKSNQFSS